MTKKSISIFPYFLISLFPYFTSCENDIEKIKLITAKDKLPVETAKNIEVLYSDSGKVQVKISAVEMNQFATEDPYLELPKGVRVSFYDEHLQVKSWLRANYAIKYERKNIMEARNNVVIVNEKGEQLNTERLIWDETKEKFFSDEFVKIATADEIIYGKGFEANQNFTKYKIFKINGTINLGKK